MNAGPQALGLRKCLQQQGGLGASWAYSGELRSKGKDIELISYSLDADERQLYRIEERDTIDYPSYCDFRTLSSPLVQKWGIKELPYMILVTPDGRIAAMGSEWMEDIAPVANELKDK